ncbi:hypothetical protein H311_02593 [Anncaliia algerae PRA109]|nr:hypothetical protein H311_02593 [Anncaliia algerae PRA109]
MDFIALISGGKDSIYTTNLLIDKGYNLRGLVYIYCKSDNLDSYMYQTVGKEMINIYSECFNVPIFVKESDCLTINKDMNYVPTENDEVEDLYKILKDLPIKYDAVSSGAILSSYQKNRVDSVCKRLQKQSLAPLFNKNQLELLKEMIDYKIQAVVIKVAGVGRNFMFKGLNDLYEYYKDKPQFNACGEGGEYETIVLDSPHFIKKIEILEHEIFVHPEEVNKKENTFYAKINKFITINK